MNDLTRRQNVLTDTPERWMHSLEQADGLKKLEATGLLQESLDQRRIISPALGGHRFSSPSRWHVVATSVVNELIEQ
jgi:hypothetical protein